MIIFHVLSRDQIKLIVDLQMKEIADRLKEHGIDIELTDAAREWLAKEGFDPQFGARPLRRTLQRKVESPLVAQVACRRIQGGRLRDRGLRTKKRELFFERKRMLSRRARRRDGSTANVGGDRITDPYRIGISD